MSEVWAIVDPGDVEVHFGSEDEARQAAEQAIRDGEDRIAVVKVICMLALKVGEISAEEFFPSEEAET